MIVGSNELFPTSILQKVYLTLMMIIGNLIIAIIVGEMSVYMSIITKRSSAFQEKLDIANTIMKAIGAKARTKIQVADFYF